MNKNKNKNKMHLYPSEQILDLVLESFMIAPNTYAGRAPAAGGICCTVHNM